MNVLRANTFHRITRLRTSAGERAEESVQIPEPTWTLIITAPKAQSWGFLDRVTRVFEGWEEAIAKRGLAKNTSSSGQEFPGDVVYVRGRVEVHWRDRIKILLGGAVRTEHGVQIEVPCAGKTKVLGSSFIVERPWWWPKKKPIIESTPPQS